jgi:hypothetical protein
MLGKCKSIWGALASLVLAGGWSSLCAAGDADANYVVHSFKRIQLTDKYWAEGVAIADLNRDGHMDVISGPFWYEGPDFKRRHEIFPATQTFTLKKDDGTQERVEGYEGALGKNNAYAKVFLVFVYDFNGDGWPDVLTIGFPGTEAAWYENPGRAGLRKGLPWKRHVALDWVGDESPTLVDLFGNSRPVFLCMSGDYLGYVTPQWSNPRAKWRFHAVSPPLPSQRVLHALGAAALELTRGQLPPGQTFAPDLRPYIHGLGYGDINADRRLDILTADGWWEQPSSLRGDPVWRFHKWSFLRERPPSGTLRAPSSLVQAAEELKKRAEFYEWPYALSGAQMFVYDVNGDGLPDIVSSLQAHGPGLAWFEQLPGRDASGEIQFKPHVLMGKTPAENKYGVEFTQLHSLELSDIDGDGLEDIIAGKNVWPNGPNGDPDNNAPAGLYWFKLARNADKSVDFVPYLIDGDSGVGRQIATGDVNGDGLRDIVVANKKGLFLFLQEVRTVSKQEWLKAQPAVQFPAAN